MKQVLQDARSGETAVLEVPAPQLLPGCVLVQVAASLVSAGTERASAEFASKSLLQKARARPDLVREVIGKVQRDGLFSAAAAVRSRLGIPTALGYSSAGTVVGVGEGVVDLRVGDRVACAGAGFAVHAEVACIPRLLVAKIPPDSQVNLDQAAFTTVGAVALHGVRTAEVGVGDVVAVIGLGLLGQLTLQILKAAGCRVLGMDLVPDRAALARRMGAEGVSLSESGFRDLCLEYSSGRGVDAVLITAETSSSGPVNLAGELARDRAVVVAVGTVGMEIERKLYYNKELDFRIARSYGPGRYDAAYEQQGRDYPIGYVRWTETRNMEAFLQLLAEGKLDLNALITHRFPIDQAHGAYELISGKTSEPSLGVLITYGQGAAPERVVRLSAEAGVARSTQAAAGFLGAGTFATGVLLPALKEANIKLVGVCTATGSKSRHVGEKFGFAYCTTDESRVLNDPATTAIFIATRDKLHAQQVCAALTAGKHVFCEKPLCLQEEGLAEIVRVYSETGARSRVSLMVGFNRRFAPMAVRLKSFLKDVSEPLAMHYRVNAGYLPPDHWVNDPTQAGGRLLGEVCHFVDFLSFLAGEPVSVSVQALANPGRYSNDNLIVSLTFANGSQGTITYVANGDKSFPKERLEVFGGGAVGVLDDFRSLELVRHGHKETTRSRWRQDKGHRAECAAFAKSISSGTAAPIAFEELVAGTLATLRAAQSLSTGSPVAVDAAGFIQSALYPSRA